MSKGDPKDEYLDASNNQRQFMSLRFAQLTVFLAITGFLINLLLGGSPALTSLGTFLLKVSGILVTVLFWIHQERTMAFWNHFVRRAARLEKKLGFQQYSTRPESGWLSSFKAMRVFFFVVLLFWIFTFFWTA